MLQEMFRGGGKGRQLTRGRPAPLVDGSPPAAHSPACASRAAARTFFRQRTQDRKMRKEVTKRNRETRDYRLEDARVLGGVVEDRRAARAGLVPEARHGAAVAAACPVAAVLHADRLVRAATAVRGVKTQPSEKRRLQAVLLTTWVAGGPRGPRRTGSSCHSCAAPGTGLSRARPRCPRRGSAPYEYTALSM